MKNIKAKILVVDDEQGIRDLLVFELGQQEYSVATAASGKEAVEKTKQERFDVAITDMKMPEMDGVAILGELKKIDPEIEVIVATGYGTIETAIESLRRGAFDYINKPFNIDEMVVVIERALEKRQFKEIIALYGMSKVIFTTLKLDELLKTIIDLVLKALKADGASLMLLDDKEKLYIAQSLGLDGEVAKETRLAMGERISGWVAKNQEPLLLVGGLENDPRFQDVKTYKKINSSIVLPLIGKRGFMGILNINRVNIANNFSQRDLSNAAVFASFVTLAIENAYLFKELQQTQQQLFQSAKMASLGQLSGGLAHEINNPLTGVLNNVQLIRMELEQKADLSLAEFKELIDTIEQSALRCRKITQSLLNFSHASGPADQPVSLDLNKEIENVAGLIEHELNLESIAVQREFQDGLLPVLGNPQLLQQVFMNLFVNARWAIQKKSKAEGGQIKVKTLNDPGKDSISISVTDTGIGMPEEVRSRLFEPFFTTKGVGEGTGLGLSVSYGIIRDHHGAIEVDSQPGLGTTFKITLPVAKQSTGRL